MPQYPDPRPDWVKRKGESVFDSPVKKVLRKALQVAGLDDPQSQVTALMTPLAPVGQRVASPLASAASKVKTELKKRIKAFHGSPHDFDKFSLEKIGTGEGAQAYGHGLYFAENEGTAKAYRDQVSAQTRHQRPFHIEQVRGLIKSGAKPDEARAHVIAGLRDQLEEANFNLRGELAAGPRQTRNTINPIDVGRAERDQIAALKKQIAEIEAWPTDSLAREPGRMYEVAIDADPDQFLDWDAPLSHQPRVLESLRRRDMADQSHVFTPEGAYPIEDTDGEALYRYYSSTRGSDVASRAARRIGIPGIKYLDQGSRGAGSGTRNYVVFDDSLVSILRKYGVALPMIEALRQQAQANGGRVDRAELSKVIG